ncbi:hypothetical protein SUGI_0843300 [Cryptomeria japonica]|nr:hypothetical protein SUGI_0843300 [Cryptomeria japonica]
MPKWAPATPPIGDGTRKIPSPLKLYPRKNKAQKAKHRHLHIRDSFQVLSDPNWVCGTFKPINNGSPLSKPELRDSNGGGRKMGTFCSDPEKFGKTYDARDVLERHIARLEKMRKNADPNSDSYGGIIRYCDCNLRKLRNLRDRLESYMKSYCDAYDLQICQVKKL